MKNRIGINRDTATSRVEKYNNNFFKPTLSVVENLIAMMPDFSINDYTNDGFTTNDVLKGNYKDKVFPTGAFSSFPNEFFQPLIEGKKDIEISQYIILSVGGNNFRELLQNSYDEKILNRAEFLKEFMPAMLQELAIGYIKIIKELRKLNKNARIILLNQYYPSAIQNNYKIYPAMHDIGKMLNLGGPAYDPMSVIQEIMQKTYSDVFQQISSENIQDIVLADITSSLNPFDANNHVSQIEPSGIGGKKIAQMLKYIITDKHITSGKSYRFFPEFFSHDLQDPHVEEQPIAQWAPAHPYDLKEEYTRSETRILKSCESYNINNVLNNFSTAYKQHSHNDLYNVSHEIYSLASKSINTLNKFSEKKYKILLTLAIETIQNPNNLLLVEQLEKISSRCASQENENNFFKAFVNFSKIASANLKNKISLIDLVLLAKLKELNVKDNNLFSSTLFSILHQKTRFELLIEKIQLVIKNYSDETIAMSVKEDSLKQCLKTIKNKGIANIYSMSTPGFQTDYQTTLDRLEILVSNKSDAEQVNILQELYAHYLSCFEVQETLKTNKPGIN